MFINSENYKKDRALIEHRAWYFIGMLCTVIIFKVAFSIPEKLYMDVFKALNNGYMDLSAMFQINLFFRVATIIAFIVFSVYVGKHKMASIGFQKKRALGDYLLGVIIGFMLMLVSVLSLVLLAGTSIALNDLAQISFVGIIVFFFGFLVQGMAEEVMFRGFIFNEANAKFGILAGVIINSIFFDLLHSMNPGYRFFSFFSLNLFLFGVFASLMYYYTDNLWMVGAVHSVWNFAQGNVFGFGVSGIDISDYALFRVEAFGDITLSGGELGIEGGLVATAVLGLGIVYYGYKIIKVRKQCKSGVLD